jgi:PilZ domain
MQYRTSGGEFTSAWKSGHTLDMSVGGILIDTPEGVPVSSMVELAIDWLGLYHGKPMVRLFVIGSVVRNDGRGTALRILSHEFRDVRSAVIPSPRTERNLAVA